MTIIKLMLEQNVRVSEGDRWITRNDDGTFTVYSREYKQKYTRVLADSVSEEQAVAAFLANEMRMDCLSLDDGDTWSDRYALAHPGALM